MWPLFLGFKPFNRKIILVKSINLMNVVIWRKIPIQICVIFFHFCFAMTRKFVYYIFGEDMAIRNWNSLLCKHRLVIFSIQHLFVKPLYWISWPQWGFWKKNFNSANQLEYMFWISNSWANNYNFKCFVNKNIEFVSREGEWC